MNKAIFLDRDGTLNPDSSYINKPEDFNFYPFVIPALKLLKKKGYLLIIISNQSGVGRGIISIQDITAITGKLKNLLKPHDISVDDFFYCYYFEKSENPEYRKNPEDRKPEPGMILKAAQKHNILLKDSYIIGDRLTDIAAGKRAGCNTILVKTGDGQTSCSEIESGASEVPDYIFDNILKAAEFICG